MFLDQDTGDSKGCDSRPVDETPRVSSSGQHCADNPELDDGTSAASPTTPTVPVSTTTTSKRPVVAVDLDEVLGQLVLQLCAFHNDAYGTTLTPEAFTCYEFHNVWGGTREEADKKMRQFFASPFFHGTGRGIPVIDGAREVLKKHAHRLDLHVVTSRQNILEDHTREWVEANYPGIFTKLHFGNHHSTEGEVRSKPDLCRAIDAVMIIDDNVRYATQCAEAGIRTCLYGDYAWNRGTDEDLPSNVHRVLNWDDVDTALDSVVGVKASVMDAPTGAEACVPAPAHGYGGEFVADEVSATCTEQESGDDGVEGSSRADDSVGGEGGTAGADGADAVGNDGDTSRELMDGVIISNTGVPVIAVEASKSVANLVELTTTLFVEYEAVCLRSLEKAVMVGVDAVQELERLGVAVKAQVRTSLVELSSGSRTCVEVTVRRSAQFVESIAEATATAASASLPPAVSNVSNVDPSGTTNQGDVPAVEAPHGQER